MSTVKRRKNKIRSLCEVEIDRQEVEESTLKEQESREFWDTLSGALTNLKIHHVLHLQLIEFKSIVDDRRNHDNR